MGKLVQPLTYNNKKGKNATKLDNERRKSGINGNKYQKINATRESTKETQGTIFEKKGDTLADYIVPKGMDTIIATNLNQRSKTETPKTSDVLHQATMSNKNYEKMGVVSTMDDTSNNIEFSHLNFHRDPGPTEPNFFHGTMFENRRPALEHSFNLHPNDNGGRSMEMEVIRNVKDNEDFNAEERDMEVVTKSDNQSHGSREGVCSNR